MNYALTNWKMNIKDIREGHAEVLCALSCKQYIPSAPQSRDKARSQQWRVLQFQLQDKRWRGNCTARNRQANHRHPWCVRRAAHGWYNPDTRSPHHAHARGKRPARVSGDTPSAGSVRSMFFLCRDSLFMLRICECNVSREADSGGQRWRAKKVRPAGSRSPQANVRVQIYKIIGSYIHCGTTKNN